jgi:oligosaccharide reducing-end xylanase
VNGAGTIPESNENKHMKLVLIFAGTMVATAFAGTVNSPYQVGTWQGFRTAAVSYTFDDNIASQYSIAVPMFNARGYKMTLFTVSGWVSSWSTLQNAAASGHEIASHTISHPDMSRLSTADQVIQNRDSKSVIEANITSQKCVTMAYPYCAIGDKSIVAQYDIGARGCAGRIEPSTPSDLMDVGSYICGSGGYVNSVSDLNGVADSAANSGGWCVYLIHDIDTGTAYPLASAVLQGSVDYMDANRGRFWVQTFGNVIRYIRERNDVSVAETGGTSNTLTVSVTHSLDNAIFNFPVTIRRPLPSGWSSASAVQGGKDLGAQIVSVSGTPCVMFDAVPNGGNVTLTAAGTGPANGTYKLVARHSGKVMDAYGAQTGNGTQIIQWTYGGGSNQRWILTDRGSGQYSIIGVQSGRCVDISNWGTANGTKVQLWDYLGGSNQKYALTAVSGGYYRITPTHATGSCLDVSGVSTADGALVHLWQWLGGSNQQWAFQAP